MKSLPLAAFASIVLAVWLLAGMMQPTAAQTPEPLRFVAIGDAGKPGAIVDANARFVSRWLMESSRDPLLFFLGDNFYPVGLNNLDSIGREELVTEVLKGFAPAFSRLGRENVHAVAGNHDYYCATVGNVPVGFCRWGNYYESMIPGWTYHAGYPVSIRRPIDLDVPETIEFILFDSALLLARNDPGIWRRSLDSLERLLRGSAADRRVRWRVLLAHHSPFTVGEHGGYRRWSGRTGRVEHIANCIDRGEDPFRYLYQWMSNADNCHPDYRRYNDSLFATLGRGGARIHLMFGGHDHSLQLLDTRERICESCPQLYVISGAGSTVGRVMNPRPPMAYTHPLNTPEETGHSVPGFVGGVVMRDSLVLTFVDGRNGDQLDMGGRRRFVIDSTGRLLPE